MDNDTAAALAEIAAIEGPQEIEIAFTDGTAIKVTVRQLAVSELTAFFGAVEDEGKLIALCTGLKADEVARLTPKAFYRLALVCDEVNTDFFGLLARRLKNAERIRPGFADKAIQAANESVRFQNGLPGSQRPRG